MDAQAPALRIVNLETAVSRQGTPWPGKGVHYRTHPANVACLAAARLDACALTNNHVLDWGLAALGGNAGDARGGRPADGRCRARPGAGLGAGRPAAGGWPPRAAVLLRNCQQRRAAGLAISVPRTWCMATPAIIRWRSRCGAAGRSCMAAAIS